MKKNIKFKNFLINNEKKVIFIIVIIFFFLLDFIITIFLNYFDTSLTCRNRHLNLIAEPHIIFHHGFKKNSIGRGYGCEKIITNSLGFKDKEIKEIKNKNNIQRILFIGDSFTEGVGLNYEDTFVGIVDNNFQNSKIEILNAGRSSYSPIIHWRKIKFLLDNNITFNHLYIFLDISDPYDEFYSYELDKNLNVISQKTNTYIPNPDSINPKMGIKTLKKIIKNNFTFLFYLSDYIYKSVLKSRYDSKEWYKWTRSKYERWTVEKNLYNKFGDHGIQLMEKYMNKIFYLANKNNFKITVAVYPRPTQIWYEDVDSIQVSFWKKWTEEKNISFINLFPLFVKKNITQAEKYKILKKYYLNGDPHFNKLGNILIANEIIKNYK